MELNNLDYQIGAELFRKLHNLQIKYPEAREVINEKGLKLEPKKPVKAGWYKKVVSGKEWNMRHSYNNYTILSMTKKGNAIEEVEFAFIAVIPPEGCLEITDIDDLLKIQKHREANNHYPQPMSIK